MHTLRILYVEFASDMRPLCRPKRIAIWPGFGDRIQCVPRIDPLIAFCGSIAIKRYRFPDLQGLLESTDVWPPTKAMVTSPQRIKGVIYVDVSLSYMIQSNEICDVRVVGDKLMNQVHC